MGFLPTYQKQLLDLSMELVTPLSTKSWPLMRTIGWVTCFHLGRSADRCYIHSLAVDYCFLANDGLEVHPELVVESFDAKTEQNDYEVHTDRKSVV